jgi:hypothetical protein
LPIINYRALQVLGNAMATSETVGNPYYYQGLMREATGRRKEAITSWLKAIALIQDMSDKTSSAGAALTSTAKVQTYVRIDDSEGAGVQQLEVALPEGEAEKVVTLDAPKGNPIPPLPLP